MKFLFVICTCQQNLKKAEYLQKLLCKFNVKNFYFYHGEGISPNSSFLKLNVSDCYSELTAKTFKMLKTIQDKHFDYLVKLDDDTFLDFKELEKLDLKEFDYIGGASSLEQHLNNFIFYKKYLINYSLKKNINFDYRYKLHNNFEYIMGNFCILRKDIIKNLLNVYDVDGVCREIPQEDISVGYACNKINARILNLAENISPFYHITRNNLSYHPIPIFLHNLFFNKSKEERLSFCNKFLPLNKYFIQKNK
jgi:hypothetical protein